ncbi:MAG: beta-lactamase family protein [Cyclobacteriaceae bacterium]|nr:beta-lactamase family protein [Cyclobacteriaceae bacterium]MDH4297351.1 beta-lactamase family protein [Cyclobacteriaceae bacterium]MDH5248174.1 beta-lactamase family protein [Cyclobacteriaceae bacterium]
MRKSFKIVALVLLSLAIVFLAFAYVTFPPVMSGMAAKTMCSCVYVTGRTPESVKERELQVFPGLASATFDINDSDSTVTAKIFWKTSKAIFRKGMGCTLLATLSEEEVRDQQILLPGPPPGQDTLDWPLGNIVTNSAAAGVNYEAIELAIKDAFLARDPKKPIFTHAVLVVYDGQIIGEKYAPGFDHHSLLMGWSMTKSITNGLIGVLVGEGRLKVDAPVPIAEWQNDDRKNITLNNLLQASSGLSWSESYFNPVSDFHNMFIRSDDKAAYAISRKLKHKPGEFFQYSSGTTNILSSIIRQTVGDDQYYRFPYEKLFYKIGMNNTLMEPDASGTFVASSYSYATARDWARFGLLYLNDGLCHGERILPQGWVAYSKTPANAAEKGQYGAQWWLNAGAKNNPADRKYPTLPQDAFWADGFEEQYVMVIPSRKLVIVRLGVSHFGSHFEELASKIIKSVPE